MNQNPDPPREPKSLPSSMSDEAESSGNAHASDLATLAESQSEGRWRHLPLPDGPDQHPESEGRSVRLESGLRIVGARVRGRRHKHEGTNCDDWFDIATTGAWSIIAVSDGAGAKPFSRVGARVACQSAIETLCSRLSRHELLDRDEWTPQTFRYGESDFSYFEPDLAYLQDALHEALESARAATESAAANRSNLPEHQSLLGRPLSPDDLWATLLLAVQILVPYRGSSYSLVMTLQVGDGISAALFRDGSPSILDNPDSGRYAGETIFVTSTSSWSRADVYRRIYPFFSPMRALMVMTDGVADDYFPFESGLRRLYDDLVEHGIIEAPASPASDAERRGPGDGSAGEQGNTEPALKVAAGDKRVDVDASEVDTGEGHGQISDHSQITVDSVASPSPPLSDAAARLKAWLDTYYVRGSFDDRTLVVLYPEVRP